MLRMIHHICIDTDCYKESIDFYVAVMGFTVVHEDMDQGQRTYNSWLKKNDILIEVQTPKHSEKVMPVKNGSILAGINHVCFLVDNIDLEVQLLKQRGWKNFNTKEDEIIYLVDGAKVCKVLAPEGTVIELREQNICF